MTSGLRVRVGVGLSPLWDEAATGRRFWETVELLEELGYDSIWLSDTSTLGGLAPLPALAAAAARTERLKLGTSVLVLPPRNPVLLARELATIDVLSSGRLLPAGGLGIDLESELRAMGVARDERVARMEEAIRIVKALWSGEPVSYQGRFWSLSDVRIAPLPSRPKLELWLGGRAPAALRRIGRLADGWLASFVAPEEFAAMSDVIRATAAEEGRAIDEDHYGATVFAVPRADELPATAARLARRPGLARADHIAFGTGELRRLLDRFLAAGASKFVIVPVARDFGAWLRELRTEVVGPIERA